MFLGELLCLIPHNLQLLYNKIRGRGKAKEEESDSLMDSEKPKPKPFTNPLIFWIPACCDLGGSTLLSKYFGNSFCMMKFNYVTNRFWSLLY